MKLIFAKYFRGLPNSNLPTSEYTTFEENIVHLDHPIFLNERNSFFCLQAIVFLDQRRKGFTIEPSRFAGIMKLLRKFFLQTVS